MVAVGARFENGPLLEGPLSVRGDVPFRVVGYDGQRFGKVWVVIRAEAELRPSPGKRGQGVQEIGFDEAVLSMLPLRPRVGEKDEDTAVEANLGG